MTKINNSQTNDPHRKQAEKPPASHENAQALKSGEVTRNPHRISNVQDELQTRSEQNEEHPGHQANEDALSKDNVSVQTLEQKSDFTKQLVS